MSRFSTLRFLVPTILVVIVVSFAIAASVFGIELGKRRVLFDESEELRFILTMLEGPVSRVSSAIDDPSFLELMSMVATRVATRDVAVVDLDGNVLIRVDRGNAISPITKDALAPFHDTNARATVELTGGTTVRGVLPIRTATLGAARPQVTAFLIVFSDVEWRVGETRRTALNAVFVFLAALIALAVLVNALFQRTITLRTKRIIDATMRRTNGDRDATTGVRGEDEIGEIAAAVDALIQSMRAVEGDVEQRAKDWATLIEQTADAVLLVDGNAAIIDANPAAVNLIGVARERLQGVDPAKLIVVDDEGRPSNSQRTETVLRRRGQTDVPVELHRQSLGHGRSILIMRDLTSAKEAEAIKNRLERTDRLASLGTLAAGVGHEINNPLTFVMGNIELMREAVQESADIPSSFADILEDAAEGAARIKTIVADLRVLAHEQNPQFDAPLTPIDLGPVIERAMRMCEPTLRLLGTVRLSLMTTAKVKADQSRLAQVVINLLMNAGDALDADATSNAIDVSVKDDGESVFIVVKDNGCGMSTEIQDRLFDPFFTTKAVGHGTGLGLAISHQIVAALGGRISVESEPGKGTVFTVALPMVTEFDEDHHLDSTRAKRIFVIDDEPQVGKIIERFLSEHRVTSFQDVDTALKAMDVTPPDVVICDVSMPDGGARTLTHRLLTENPGMLERVLLMTGGTPLVIERDAPNGNFVILRKPFVADVLRHSVDRLLLNVHRRPLTM